MPTPKKLKIDPTKLNSRSEEGKFLRGFLMKRQNDPRYYVLFKGTEYEYRGRKFTLTHALHRRNIVVDNNELPRYLVVSNPPGEEDYIARGNQALVGRYAGVLHPLLNTMLYSADTFAGDRIYKNIICTNYNEEMVREQEQALHTEWTYATLGGKLAPKNLLALAGRLGGPKKNKWGFYYYMRRAEGCSLTELLKKEEGKLDRARLVSISLALIQALYFQVTRHNVIHCDIKPDNIFIAEHPRNEVFSATIIDYGFAMSKFDSVEPVQGTPEYLPPEYKNEKGGRKKEAVHDLKFDVYSLGKVLEKVWSESSEQEPQVRKLIDAALSSNPEARPDLRDLYLSFLRVGGFSENTINANLTGQSVRLELETLKTVRSLRSEKKQEKERDFMECIRRSLREFEDTPNAVEAYISGLGWDALILANHRYDLSGKSPKWLLLKHIESILAKRSRAVAVLEKARQQLAETHIKLCEKNLKYFSHIDSYVAIYEAFKTLIEKYNKRIEKIKDLPLDLDELSIKTDRLLHEMASLGELHNLVHLNVNNESGQSWIFPRDYAAYQAAGNNELALAVSEIMGANIDHYDATTKEKIDALVASENFSFEDKRDRLVEFLAAGKYQKMYVELCMAEKRSPVYAVEPYFIVINELETINNQDMDGKFLKLIAQALRDYLSEVSDDRNLSLLYRAASNNRLEDIKKIHELIPAHPNHNDFLAGLKDVIANMKTGPLGRSLLKDKLSAAIKTYEGEPDERLLIDKLTPVVENHERRKQKMAKTIKKIKVTELNKVPDVDLNRSISQFLKEQIRVKNNFMVFAGHKYLFKGEKLVFSHDLVVSQANDDGSPLRLAVVNGLIDNKDEGATQLYDVCGHLELMHGDGCVYRANPGAEVLRHYGPDIRLRQKAMRQEFEARYARLNEWYQGKKAVADPEVPAVHTKFNTKDKETESMHLSLFVLQQGTSLANFLKVQGPFLSEDDRVRLTNGLLAAYRYQVRDTNSLLGYVDLNSIIIAVDEAGEYKFDLFGDGLHDAPNGVLNSNLPAEAQPHFMHPEGVKVKHYRLQGGHDEEVSIDFNYRTDAWSIGRVLCEVWDKNQSLKSWSETKYLKLHNKKYDKCFEAKALQKIKIKEDNRGFLGRFFGGLKERFFPYKTNEAKIKAKLTRDECVAIQQAVEKELSYEMAREVPHQLDTFCQQLEAPARVKHVLKDLLSPRTAVEALSEATFNVAPPVPIQRVREKAPPVNANNAKEMLQIISTLCSNLVFAFNDLLFEGQELMPWAGLMEFQKKITNFRKRLGPFKQPAVKEVGRFLNDWMEIQHQVDYEVSGKPNNVRTLKEIQKVSSELCSQAHLYFNNQEKFKSALSPWKDLKAFNESLVGCFDGERCILTEAKLNYFLDKWRQIKASIDEVTNDENARPFNVIYTQPGNDYSKLLFRYLKSQVDQGVTWFGAGHVFLDENGEAYQLSHTIEARKKEDGRIHYDVLRPLRVTNSQGMPDDSKERQSHFVSVHTNIYEVGYVLKPAFDDSLMCVRRSDKTHQARRLVKRNVGNNNPAVIAEEVKGEVENLKRIGLPFKVKNNEIDPHVFNEKRQPGVSYSAQVDKDAQLSNDDPKKLQRFLALVRAFFVQVELNGMNYTDVKPGNLILNELPNGESMFSVIDFETNRNNYYSFPPRKYFGFDEEAKCAFLDARQPLFGLGVFLAHLYLGLEEENLSGYDEDRYDALLELVKESERVPDPVKQVILDLLSIKGSPEIGSVRGLLAKVHELSGSHEGIVKAYDSGCQMRFEMKKMDSKDKVVEAIMRHLHENSLPDVIQAFIRGLGFEALLKKINSITTREALINEVGLILDYKAAIKAGWEAKRDALSALKNASELEPRLLSRPQRDALNLALREVHVKTGYVGENGQIVPGNIEAHYGEDQCDLDAIDEAHTRLLGFSMQEFDRVHRSAVHLSKSLAPRVEAILLKQALGAEDPVKQACAIALDGYTKEKGALSVRRSRDILKLKDIITRAQDTETLQTGVTEYVKNSLAGGMFGTRSLWKGKLAASLLDAVKPRVGRG